MVTRKTGSPTKETPTLVKEKPNGAAPETKSIVAKTKPVVAKSKPVAAAKKPGKPAVSASIKTATPVAKPVASPDKVLPKAKPAPEQKEKIKKPKLVRDSFTMPEAEYQVLGDVKKACLKAGIAVKKSELLRVGVALIKNMDVARLKAAVSSLPPLKAGRPKKC